MHLFDEDKIIYNFRNMDEIYPVTTISPSNSPLPTPRNKPYTLPRSFNHLDSTLVTSSFLLDNMLEGLLIIQNDSIIYESYQLGLKPSDTHISWSLSKSVLSTMLGVAYDDGLLDLEKTVDYYLPQFAESAYNEVSVKNVLQMSSGVAFNEDHSDFNSDINRFSRVFATGGALEDFAMTLEREREPGTYCHYVSINTQILGMILTKVTGITLTTYLREKLWEPLGMQDSAQWIIDNTGMEVALGGLNMSLRDYAKVGLLYLNMGKGNASQIVSSKWITSSITPNAPHLMPGKHNKSSNQHGYGYQWFIPSEDEGDYFATGLNDQFIYINPSADLVVTALSANHHSIHREQGVTIPHIDLFKRIADDFIP